MSDVEDVPQEELTEENPKAVSEPGGEFYGPIMSSHYIIFKMNNLKPKQMVKFLLKKIARKIR